VSEPAAADGSESDPDGEIEVDMAAETVTYGGQEVGVSGDDTQRKALVDGIWDTTALMKAKSRPSRGRRRACRT